jgi:aminomethyltransferase
MPLEFGRGTIAEHMSCRRHAALFDVSHLGTVRLSGRQVLGKLQRAFTNDLCKIGPGRAQYTHLLDEDGSVLDDLIVWWVSGERFDVMPNASNTSRVREAVGGDDVTDGRAVLAVQGPAARAVVTGVFPEAAQVGRSRVEELHWRGSVVVVAGTGYTGEDGLELAAGLDVAMQLWEALRDAGAEPAGLGARDTLRLEAGLPLHGHELGPGVTPLEAGMSWVVAWDKPGGFNGLAALVDRRRAGLAKTLKGVVGQGRRPLRPGYPVHVGGEPAGVITSGNFSPVLGRGIGMCFLAPEVAVGVDVTVEPRGRSLECHVTTLPFVPRARVAPPVPPR